MKSKHKLDNINNLFFYIECHLNDNYMSVLMWCLCSSTSFMFMFISNDISAHVYVYVMREIELSIMVNLDEMHQIPKILC